MSLPPSLPPSQPMSMPVNAAAVPVTTGEAMPAAGGAGSGFDALLQQLAGPPAQDAPIQMQTVEAAAADIQPEGMPAVELPAATVQVLPNGGLPVEPQAGAEVEADTADKADTPEATVAVDAQMAAMLAQVTGGPSQTVQAPASQPSKANESAAGDRTDHQARPPAIQAPPPAVTPAAKAAAPEPQVISAADMAGGEAETGSGEPDESSQGQTVQPEGGKSNRAEVMAALDKARSALETPAAAQPSATQPAATQPPAETPSASAQTQDTSATPGFGLQTISDTQGSYTATGASAAAGSNMSRAAVETLSALSMQINKKLEQGNTKFAIELYPADLGKVEVALHIARDGRTTAHLTFDSPITAASFSASEPELRQHLASAGLSLDKDALSFSSRDSGNGFGSALNQQQQQQQQPHSQQAVRAMQAARRAADDADLDAALMTAAADLRNRTTSTLALNLIV